MVLSGVFPVISTEVPGRTGHSYSNLYFNAKNAVVRSVYYKVRSGDSLARIAKKFNVKVTDIVKWNQIDTKKYLQPGQSLKLYVDVTRT